VLTRAIRGQKINLLKLIALLIAASGIVHPSPRDFFGQDYNNALFRLKKDSPSIHRIAGENKVDEKIICALVFPEYIRYSVLSGLLETKALDVLYLAGGSKTADFSIGHFQMKPSFAEGLEEKIKADAVWKKKYAVLIPTGKNKHQLRGDRLKKLKQLDHQVRYACAFVEVCTKNYQLETLGEDEKLQYLSTIYNRGMQVNKKEIESSLSRRTFPYGVKYKEQQFAYWEVALDYYLKHGKHEKNQ
jgi:hypothetical protein